MKEPNTKLVKCFFIQASINLVCCKDLSRTPSSSLDIELVKDFLPEPISNMKKYSFLSLYSVHWMFCLAQISLLASSSKQIVSHAL